MHLNILGQSWSVRVIMKSSEKRQMSEVEVKRMIPTIAEQGLVDTYCISPATFVECDMLGSPVAVCKQIGYDTELSCALVRDKLASSVRVLVTIQDAGDEEEVARPDTPQRGFCVRRRARCALERDDAKEYIDQRRDKTDE